MIDRKVGGFVLRDYQVQAVEALRANIRRGVRQQILCSPTGSGKTVIACAMIASAQRKKSKVAFVCDRQNLVMQTSDRLREAGIEHGVLMGDSTHGTHRPIRVCSAQTLESRGFHDVDLLVIDECHELRKALLGHVKERDVLTIGMSATPMSKGLGKTYGAVVNVATTSDLIAQGHLSPLKVIAPKAVVDTDGLRVNNGEWAKDDVSERARRIVGDVLAEWDRVRHDFFDGTVPPTIAFAATVDDSHELADRFREAGHDFQVVSYRQSAEEKDAIIRRYRDGVHDGLVSCSALSRGFDAPETAIMIDQYPLRSSLMTELQRLGRVMRTAKGKEFGVVIDHAENWLAFHREIHDFYDRGVDALDDGDHKAVRKQDDLEARKKALVCANCRTVVPPSATACPSCGKARPRRPSTIDRVDGDMGLVDEVDGQGRALQATVGDLWPHVCAHTLEQAMARGWAGDDERLRKTAQAKFRELTGRWGPRTFAPAGQCDPRVAHVLEENTRKWLNRKRREGYAKRSRRGAAA